MSDINTARSSFDHAGFEKFMNASSDSLSDPSSPRKKPGRRVRAAGGGSKKRAAGGKRAKAEEKPWWDQGGGGGGGGGFDVNSSGGSSEVAQLGTGKNFLRQTRDPPQQSGVASIGRVEDSDDFALEAEEDPQQRLGRAPAATDDDELRLQLTRSSLGDSETPAAPPMRGYAGNSRDADDLTTMDTESAAAADPSAGGLAGFKGKPSMLSKVSLLESLDSSSQQLQQPSAAQQPQEQHHGDTLHSQTDISAVRDAYKRRLDTLEESTDQRHSKATTGFFASGLNSLPSDQIPEPGQQQQQSGNVGGAMTATAPSATQSFGMQVIRPANKTEQKEMSIDDLLAEHDEVLTARPDSQRHPQLTPSPPPSPQQQQQQPQSAQRRHRQAAFDETKIVANPKVVRPPRAPAAAASAGDAPKRPQKQQQKPAAGKTKQPAGPPPQVKLESDLRLMELERAKEAEAARRKHEQEVQQLRQEICTLEARLEVEPQQQQQQQQSVWRLVKQRPLGPDVTREEVDQLTNQMREQEELLAGYQKENERLYAELKSAKASGKGLADALSGQKLQLEQELREAREQLERQEVQLRSRLPQQPGPSAGPVSNAGPLLQQQERCAQLEAELRACRRRLDEALAESSSCQRDRLELQQQLDRLTRERLAAADQLTAAKSVRGVELEKMREQYETEIDRLQRKMTWFVENQRLVDKDQTKLREQNAAIAELRDRLEASEKQRLELLNRRRKRQGGKAVDGGDFENDDGGGSAARIKDLERQ
uniref:Centrosomal protein of 162 kDa n=1 Tax=Macrostomum lignano TaxID=282301 RepID=A0A1I8GAD7_9PLAT